MNALTPKQLQALDALKKGEQIYRWSHGNRVYSTILGSSVVSDMTYKRVTLESLEKAGLVNGYFVGRKTPQGFKVDYTLTDKGRETQ